jgi:hypothetical protein
VLIDDVPVSRKHMEYLFQPYEFLCVVVIDASHIGNFNVFSFY